MVNSGTSTKTPPLPLFCLRPPCPTPPNHGRREDQPRLWRWYYPTGKQPDFPTTLPPTPVPTVTVLADSTRQLQQQQTAPPRHRRRALGSAHRRSLRRQRRRLQSTLASAPHFAPRQQKHSIKWLLKQTQLFPPTITTTVDDDANHHPRDDQNSSIPSTQIDSYIRATALILDAALHDFEQDTYHDPPHPLRTQIDSHDLTDATLILDAALRDLADIANQHATPAQDDHNDKVAAPAHRCNKPPSPNTPRVPLSSTTTRLAHSKTAAPPVLQRLTRSMTAAARRRTTAHIIVTDSTQTPHHATTQKADADRLDRTDTPSPDDAPRNKTETPRTHRSTVCIPDSDNTPWNTRDGDIINDWLDDTEYPTISWHTARSPPTDDDTFNDLTADDNDNHATNPPSPPPPTTATPAIRRPHPSSPHQLDISAFVTQNAHGLRRLPRDAEGKLITTEPYDYTRYEHLISIMKTKNLDVYFVQETWLEGDAFDEVINSYQLPWRCHHIIPAILPRMESRRIPTPTDN